MGQKEISARIKEEQKERKLFNQIQTFVSQLTTKDQLDNLVQAVDAISKNLEQTNLPAAQIAEISLALREMTQVYENNGRDNSEMVRAFKEFGTIIARNLTDLQSVIMGSQDPQILDGLKNNLNEIKVYLQRNEEAEWDFNISRDGNGDMTQVKVTRIK